MNLLWKVSCALVCTSLAAASASSIANDAWPTRSIRVVVPFPPGGSNDIVARLISAKLQESLGQPVVVENRPGGNAVIGTSAVATAAPDGYTLLVNSMGGISLNAVLYSKLPYDVQTALAPVTTLVMTPMIIGINSAVPATSLTEFIAYARANPGKLNNSAGSTISHVAAELFKQSAGINAVTVNYKGSAPSVMAVAAGETQFVILDTQPMLPHIQSARVRPLAILWPHRLAALPDVPTISEAGLAGFDFKVWIGMFAPAGTPSTIISKLSTEVRRVLALPEIQERIGGAMVEPIASTPDEFAALIDSEIKRYGVVVKSANIKVE